MIDEQQIEGTVEYETGSRKVMMRIAGTPIYAGDTHHCIEIRGYSGSTSLAVTYDLAQVMIEYLRTVAKPEPEPTTYLVEIAGVTSDLHAALDHLRVNLGSNNVEVIDAELQKEDY